MRAGPLTERISIEQNTPTQSGTGEEQDSWSEYAARWAQYMPAIGREFWDAQQMNVQQPATFILRYDSVIDAVTTDMRIIYKSRTFRIHAVRDVRGEHRMVEITSSELNP